MSIADTNQTSEDELNDKLYDLAVQNVRDTETGEQFYALAPKDVIELIRTEKLKLLNELDKSMPTAEQLTTKYGYYMPEKQYGYKLALHDIREALTKLEAEL